MSEWPVVPFYDLSAPGKSSFSVGPFGSAVTTVDYVDRGIPFIRGTNLARGIFVDGGFVYISESKAEEVGSAVVGPGDLVFTRKGTIGQVSMIPRAPRYSRYVISGSQMKARLDPAISVSEFYYYWFRSDAGQQALLANASTVGVPSIANSLATLKSIKVPIPPLKTQAAIAAVLGALDDKIAVNEQISHTALELASATYSRSADGPGWRTVLLADAAEWYSGGTPKTSEPRYWGGDIPWISALSLKSPWIDDSDRKLTAMGAANGTRIVSSGVVMFVVRGSSLKNEFRIGVTQREVAFGQDCKALVPVAGVSSDILFHAIRARTDEILGMVDETSIGAGRLATELLQNLLIKLPMHSEDEVTRTCAALNSLAAERQCENRRLNFLRDFLLPKLMSGEIRVRDAEKIVEEAT